MGLEALLLGPIVLQVVDVGELLLLRVVPGVGQVGAAKDVDVGGAGVVEPDRTTKKARVRVNIA